MATSGSRGTRALLVLLTGQAMGSFDGSAVTVAAPGIQADLRCSGSTLQLLLSGYLVAFGILVVPGARWGDDIGHRRIFVVGLAGFTGASLTCGVAPWAALLIVSRILQGAGAALMLPQVLSIVQLTSSGRARERALSLYSATLAIGVILGQVLGGFLVRADLLGTGWRAVFLVNVPLGVLLLAVAPRVLPSTAGNRPRPLRPRDATLLAVASGLLLISLLVGREQHWPGWVWPCLLMSGLVGALFARVQVQASRRGDDPILDFSVLTAPGVARRLTSACLIMGGYAGVVLVLTLHLQRALHLSAGDAGLAFAPYAIGFAISSVVLPHLPVGVKRWTPAVGPLLMAAAIGGVATLAGRSWTPAASALLVVAGASHAATFGPVVNAMTTNLRPDQASAASGLVSTGTLMAEALGIAAIGGTYLSVVGTSAAAGRSAAGLEIAAALLASIAAVAAYLGRAEPAPRPHASPQRSGYPG